MRVFKGLLASAPALLLCGVLGATSPASATTAVFSGSLGSLNASVGFSDAVAGQLTVTLKNTSATDVLVPTDVLTAVFFNTSGFTLTPVSATVAAGSTVLFGSAPGGNVGGEWAYLAPDGISSSGLGIFGSANFGGSNLQGPAAVDGLQYGITSAGDNSATGNAAVTGGNALIQNAVVFVLTVGGTLDLTKITNVVFQYGTALTDPHFGGSCTNCIPPPPVPLPPAIALFVSGLVGLGALGMRRRRVTAAI